MYVMNQDQGHRTEKEPTRFELCSVIDMERQHEERRFTADEICNEYGHGHEHMINGHIVTTKCVLSCIVLHTYTVYCLLTSLI